MRGGGRGEEGCLRARASGSRRCGRYSATAIRTVPRVTRGSLRFDEHWLKVMLSSTLASLTNILGHGIVLTCGTISPAVRLRPFWRYVIIQTLTKHICHTSIAKIHYLSCPKMWQKHIPMVLMRRLSAKPQPKYITISFQQFLSNLISLEKLEAVMVSHRAILQQIFFLSCTVVTLLRRWAVRVSLLPHIARYMACLWRLET